MPYIYIYMLTNVLNQEMSWHYSYIFKSTQYTSYVCVYVCITCNRCMGTLNDSVNTAKYSSGVSNIRTSSRSASEKSSSKTVRDWVGGMMEESEGVACGRRGKGVKGGRGGREGRAGCCCSRCGIGCASTSIETRE